MKNLIIKAKNFRAAMFSRARAAFCRTQAVLACNKAEGFVDTAVFS